MITAGMALESDPGILAAAARGLTEANILLMRRAAARGRPIPMLYRAGVRYQREPTGQEAWDTVDRVMRRGYGDCEDLAAWLAAELRFTGVDPLAAVVIRRTGPQTMHAQVESRGQILDPSRRLGMGGGQVSARRPELGADPGQIAYRIERVPGAWLVRVYAPGSGQPPAMAIARDAAMFPSTPGKPTVKMTPAKQKVAKKRGKKSAVNFVKRMAKKGAKVALPMVANSFAPGSGALLSAAMA